METGLLVVPRDCGPQEGLRGDEKEATKGWPKERPDVEMVAYRVAKQSLHLEIRSSQEKAWKKLCGAVKENPWGLPYKIVMRKIGDSLPGEGDGGGKRTVPGAGPYVLGHGPAGWSGSGP